MEKISVIIPIYNAEIYLEECIKSVQRQSYKNLEIILVNDNSIDNSDKICENFKKIDSRIRYINLSTNKGVSNARNVGIDHSTGKYVGFIDADDIIEKDFLKILLDNMKEYNTDLSILGYKTNTNEVKNTSKSVKKFNKEELLYEILKPKSIMGFSWNKLYKNSILQDKNIRFDTTICIYEDLLFNVEYILNMQCEYGCYDNRRLYCYIQRESGAICKKFKKTDLTCNDALNRIYEIYQNKCLNLKWINYKYVIANLDIKEKLLGTEYENVYGPNANRYISDNLKYIMKNKEIAMKEKTKILFKNYFIKEFIFCKKELKKWRR